MTTKLIVHKEFQDMSIRVSFVWGLFVLWDYLILKQRNSMSKKKSGETEREREYARENVYQKHEDREFHPLKKWNYSSMWVCSVCLVKHSNLSLQTWVDSLQSRKKKFVSVMSCERIQQKSDVLVWMTYRLEWISQCCSCRETLSSGQPRVKHHSPNFVQKVVQWMLKDSELHSIVNSNEIKTYNFVWRMCD